MELWKHQIEAINRAREKDFFALFYEPGCLASHTKIKINRAGISREYTIEQLYRLFNHTELSTKHLGFDLKIPTKVRSWDGELIRLNKIKKVIRSGEKKVIRLRLSRENITLTPDHEVLTRRGWVRAGKLRTTDFVAIDITRRHQKKVKKSKPKKNRYLTLKIGRFHKYKSTIRFGKYLNKKGVWKRYWFYRIETHRLVYEADLNGLPLHEFIKRTHSKNNLKFINPNIFHVHHKDGNHLNNALPNLEALSNGEHRRLHGREGGYTNFGHGKVAWRRVSSVVPVGKEMTYDIVCEDPHRNFVANDIVVHNCGKTAATIRILEDKFKKEGGILNTLILAPLVVIEQWKREFERFSSINQDQIVTMTGTGNDKIEAFSNLKSIPFIAITNYESLYNSTIVMRLEKWIEVLVCDESSRLKEVSAKRTKITQKLASKCKYRFILSGTPILSSPMDIFSQFKILDLGETFGNNFYVFRATYFHDKNSTWRTSHGYFPNWVPKTDCNELISQKIAPHSMRITKDEALDLPELVKEKIFVELTDQQNRAYKSMREAFIAYINDKASVAQLAITKTLRLQQIVSGFLKLDDDSEKEFEDTPKLAALTELLSDLAPFHKVIVWAVFKKNYEQIRRICLKLNLVYAELHGEVTDKDSQIRAFMNNPTCRVMIGHPGSGGIGVSLTVAGYSIFYSRGFSMEFDVQAESRNHRGGSLELGHKKITRIDLLAKGTIDELILQAIELKLKTSEQILGYVRGRI